MKHKFVRIAIFVLAVFGTLTTVAGGFGLLTGGIKFPLSLLQGTPFSDYTIPGLALAIIVGGSMLFASTTILSGREVGVLASASAGLSMIIFEIVEIVIIDRFEPSWLTLAIALQVFYLVLGLAISGLAAFLWVTEFRGHRFPIRHASHA